MLNLKSAQIQHGPGRVAHRSAGYAATCDFKSDPTWQIHALEKSHNINPLIGRVLNGHMRSPLIFQLLAQQFGFFRYLMAPKSPYRGGVGLTCFLEHRFASGRAEEIPVVAFQLNQLHGFKTLLKQSRTSVTTGAVSRAKDESRVAARR